MRTWRVALPALIALVACSSAPVFRLLNASGEPVVIHLVWNGAVEDVKLSAGSARRFSANYQGLRISTPRCVFDYRLPENGTKSSPVISYPIKVRLESDFGMRVLPPGGREQAAMKLNPELYSLVLRPVSENCVGRG